MKIRSLLLPICAALLVTGCGKKSSTAANSDAAATATASSSGNTSATAATPASSAPAAATSASSAAATSGSGRVVEITGNDQMKFSVASIEAKAGEELKVKLTNVGQLPKEAMGHNWVLLQKGTDVAAFAAAASTAKDTDYIPASMKDKVIAHTKVLGPKQSDEITFKAPEAGEYTFICSFPGHYFMMKGTLTVR